MLFVVMMKCYWLVVGLGYFDIFWLSFFSRNLVMVVIVGGSGGWFV